MGNKNSFPDALSLVGSRLRLDSLDRDPGLRQCGLVRSKPNEELYWADELRAGIVRLMKIEPFGPGIATGPAMAGT